MNISQNIHRVRKIRIDRVTDIGDSITITLQILADGHKEGSEGAFELTLFDLPLGQVMSLYKNFGDKDTHWLGDDFLNDPNPIAVAAAKIESLQPPKAAANV